MRPGRSKRGVAAVVAALVIAGACSGGGHKGAQKSVNQPATGFVAADSWTTAQNDFLAFATKRLDPGSPLSAIAHAERAKRDPSFSWDSRAVTPASLAPAFKLIDTYGDTADFDLMYLLNLWYGYRDQLRPETAAAIAQRMKSFKFWYTDPTPAGFIDQRWYWSENHRLIYHAIEYLTGQAFPNEKIGTDHQLGTVHRDRARGFILSWLDEKARYGFDEWHSDVYYQKDVDALLTIIEWADDPALVTRASALLDLFMFDLALHQLKGNNGVTHGRSYMKDKSNAFDEDVFGLVKLAFGTTSAPYPSADDPGAVLLARAHRYRLPAVIQRAARSTQPYVDQERMNVPIDPSGSPSNPPPEGFAFDDPNNVDFYWDRGALTAAPVVPLTLETADKYNLWQTDFFKPFTALRDLTGGDPKVASDLAAGLAPMIAFSLLSEVHTETYRTGDVMLSTALDYRPGSFGEQYHAWQATLDERAIVFTTLPRNEPQIGTQWPDEDGYWTGTGAMPRSAQDRNVGIHLYAPAFASPGPGALEHFSYLNETHAYFPQERFDEVERAGHWTFGKRGDGYVALYSWRPTEWRPSKPGEFTHGLTRPFDLVAPGGADNVWVVEVGDKADSGTFDQFRARIAAAPVTVQPRPKTDKGLPGGFDVTYVSPSRGRMTFGSGTTPFTVAGKQVSLRPALRYDNPWAHVAWKQMQIDIADREGALHLDLDKGIRTAT
jgi:hypothetical protein